MRMRLGVLTMCFGVAMGPVCAVAQQGGGAMSYQAQARERYVAKHPEDTRLRYAPPPPRRTLVAKKRTDAAVYPAPSAENKAGAEDALQSQEPRPAPDVVAPQR